MGMSYNTVDWDKVTWTQCLSPPNHIPNPNPNMMILRGEAFGVDEAMRGWSPMNGIVIL